MIRYENESLALIGIHNGRHGNCNLDTEKVTGIVDNSHSRGERGDEMVSQRQTESITRGRRGDIFMWSDLKSCAVEPRGQGEGGDYILIYNICNLRL